MNKDGSRKETVDQEREPAQPEETPPLPTFLIIGGQKCASRWFRINLGRHPDIYTSDRILRYFSGRYKRGLDWYRAQFGGWRGEPFVGEASPTYMLWDRDPAAVAERIDTTLPGVRLLAILRNPIDRTYSAFIHHMRRKRISLDADLVEHVTGIEPEQDPLQLIAASWYGAILEPYVERFGDRLHVVLQEDAKTDPHAVYREALAHLGARTDFVPDEISDVIFSRKPPKGSRHAGVDGRRRPLNREERNELYTRFFKSDIDLLERSLGRDLSIWREQ